MHKLVRGWRWLAVLAALFIVGVGAVVALDAGPLGSVLFYGRILPPQVFADARRVWALPAVPIGQLASGDLPGAAALRLYEAQLPDGRWETRVVYDPGRPALELHGTSLADTAEQYVGALARDVPQVPVTFLGVQAGRQLFILGRVDPAAMKVISVVVLHDTANRQLTQMIPAGGVVDLRNGLFLLQVMRRTPADTAVLPAVGSIDLTRLEGAWLNGKYRLNSIVTHVPLTTPQTVLVIPLPGLAAGSSQPTAAVAPGRP